MNIFMAGPGEILGFIITSLLIFLLVVFVCIKCKKILIRISLPILAFAFFLFYVFALVTPAIVLSFIILLLSFMSMIQNPGVFHAMFANGTNEKKHKKSKDDTNSALVIKLSSAIQYMSNNKIGALICFEKTQNLEPYIKDGVRLNCPLNPELIETIFYEGTRLHDGAMICRGSTIIAANVFLPSTKKALEGKYGARHRAALGISENSDAVVVVVSEETGRISIAYNGYIDVVPFDNFASYFTDIMERESEIDDTKN